MFGISDGEQFRCRHIRKSVLYKHDIWRQPPNCFEATGSINARRNDLEVTLRRK